MRARTKWMPLRVAIVLASAILIALTIAPSASSASTTLSENAAQMAEGTAATLDAPPSGVTTDPAPAGLQMTDDHDGWDVNGGWWIVMVIVMVLFWGGVLAVAVWGIQQFTKGRDGGQSALDIAKERYAKGEINAEEFEKLRRDLG